MEIASVVILAFLPWLVYLAVGLARRIFSLAWALGLALAALGAVVLAVFSSITLSLPSLEGLPAAFYGSFVTTALVEEASKLAFFSLALWIGSRASRASRRVPLTVSTLAQAALFGLAFAGFESMIYSASPSFYLVIRALTASPVHALSSALAVAWARTRGKGPFAVRWGFPLAAVLHGTYSFFLMRRVWLAPLSLVALGALALLVRQAVLHARSLESASASSLYAENYR